MPGRHDGPTPPRKKKPQRSRRTAASAEDLARRVDEQRSDEEVENMATQHTRPGAMQRGHRRNRRRTRVEEVLAREGRSTRDAQVEEAGAQEDAVESRKNDVKAHEVTREVLTPRRERPKAPPGGLLAAANERLRQREAAEMQQARDQFFEQHPTGGDPMLRIFGKTITEMSDKQKAHHETNESRHAELKERGNKEHLEKMRKRREKKQARVAAGAGTADARRTAGVDDELDDRPQGEIVSTSRPPTSKHDGQGRQPGLAIEPSRLEGTLRGGESFSTTSNREKTNPFDQRPSTTGVAHRGGEQIARRLPPLFPVLPSQRGRNAGRAAVFESHAEVQARYEASGAADRRVLEEAAERRAQQYESVFGFRPDVETHPPQGLGGQHRFGFPYVAGGFAEGLQREQAQRGGLVGRRGGRAIEASVRGTEESNASSRNQREAQLPPALRGLPWAVPASDGRRGFPPRRLAHHSINGSRSETRDAVNHRRGAGMNSSQPGETRFKVENEESRIKQEDESDTVSPGQQPTTWLTDSPVKAESDPTVKVESEEQSSDAPHPARVGGQRSSGKDAKHLKTPAEILGWKPAFRT
ncbi:uncharacterized protein MYCGRDRAFT_94768 [Zymoseptoria tritici IPO323]|uniref:Uncharacterized protein n=1 Tax=Zymoseptoria tritici (strain CBS 115943 / IPO323) TaxID=336722 RepID=F9XF40_ZYMTI|nr:uncharacterized protein MYCGRDRAFT_94768 [Zymoseptoria tritici IPO323]EGP85957.1 hypothetical protein MYCGRDRAFT_94768 [Zymoseptoria tritici IPO323]